LELWKLQIPTSLSKKLWQHQSHQDGATELEAQSITGVFTVPTQKHSFGAGMEAAMPQKMV
jgi:hypothetical protein